MDSRIKNSKLWIDLNNDEALVLFDWLARFNESLKNSFQDQSEQRVLFDLESVLEKNLTEIFDKEYDEKLMQARERIRNRE